MNETLFKVKQVGAFILFILITSLLGMVTGKPIMMVVYGVFFAVVSIVILLIAKRNQRHFEIKEKQSNTVPMVFGIVLGVLALLLPLLSIQFSSLIPLGETNVMTLLIATGLNILFLAMMMGSAYLMNKEPEEKAKQVMGYIGIILASIIPGLTMVFIDRSTVGIGSAYYIALAVLILAVNSYNLLLKQD